MRNRTAVLEEFGKIILVDREVPVPKWNEVLIGVEYVGICGSNLHMFLHGATTPPEDPGKKLVLGHECAGRVVEIGGGVQNIRVGDRVLIEPGVPCGRCRYCRSGRYNLCPEVAFLDVQPEYHGAMREYVAFPASHVFRLPPNMSTLEGALVEPAAVGMHAVELAGVEPGKRVVILGAGCIGLMTLQACRLMGASRIAVVDLIPKRLELAQKLGADLVIHGGEQDPAACVKRAFPEGADLVFETAGAKATAQMAFQTVARGGKILMVGTIPEAVPVPFLQINREVSIQTVFRYANNFPAAIEAIAGGRFDVKSLVTHIYPFSQSQLAFTQSLAQRETVIKAVIQVKE